MHSARFCYLIAKYISVFLEFHLKETDFHNNPKYFILGIQSIILNIRDFMA